MSQVKDPVLKDKLENLIPEIAAPKPKKTEQAPDPTLPKDPDEIIGIDESGKGDYFGPLVVAAVHINKDTKALLKEKGVADSKRLTDKKITELAPFIKENCSHSLVVMHNHSYNEVYEKFQNLNHILAWGHAKVLENTLEQVECQYALSDQFGDPSLVKNALMVKGKQVTLFQRTKAESNLAVAAASVLARAAFIADMEKIGKIFQMTFPKGASQQVVDTAKKFVKKYSKEELEYVAKLHFKITDTVIE